VWGKDRPTAIARMIRALKETKIVGVHTTIPADIAILEHPDFAAVKHSTKWVEDGLDLSKMTSSKGDETAPPDVEGEPAKVRRDLDVEVNGKRFRVAAWVPDIAPTVVGVAAGAGAAKPKRAAAAAGAGAGGSGAVTVPMQGTIVKVLVAVGQSVASGEAVVVLEAMKMENQINAEKGGVVKEIKVKEGDTVGAGDVVVVIE
jgi:acetyl-CoA/propionyl-CoA carboxylase, biotin carboxylase, biotin carboxyl carrier protein